MSYGITDAIKASVDKKIEKQKEFLSDGVIELSNGKNVNLLDGSYSPNINPKKYFSEMNNRVDGIFKYAESKRLAPVFLTITLPSKFHPSSEHYENLSIKEGIRHLSKNWTGFQKLKLFEHIREYAGEAVPYIKVYEPHKSGIAHLHILVFVPRNFIIKVRKRFYSYLKEKGFKQIKVIYKWKGNEVGAKRYILKYLNKTFKNAKDGVMSDEAYWFAYNKVIRFTSSRTNIPLRFYRKINFREEFQSIYETTTLYKKGHIIIYSHGDTISMIAVLRVVVDIFDIPTGDVIEETIYQRDPNLDYLSKTDKRGKAPKRKHKKDRKYKPPFIPLERDGRVQLVHNKSLEPVSFTQFSKQSIQQLLIQKAKYQEELNNPFLDLEEDETEIQILTNRLYWLDKELEKRGIV